MIGRIAVLALAATTATAQDIVRIAVGFALDDAICVPSIEAGLETAATRRDAERATGKPAARIDIVVGEDASPGAGPIVVDARASGSPGAPTRIFGNGARLLGGRTVPRAALRADLPPELRRRLPSDSARDAVRWIDLGSIGIDRAGPIVPRGMGRATQPAPAELFWNGRSLPLARWPDTGFAKVDAIVDRGSVPRDSQPDVARPERGPVAAPARGGTFRFDDPRVERWQAEGAWMLGYWKWDWADELLPVARIDPEQHTITLALPHNYGLAPEARFAALNLLEELDRPGECVLDEGRNAFFVWPPDDDENPEIVVSTGQQPLLHLRGAEHVEIHGLEFAFGRGPAIRIDGGAFVTIEDCRVRAPGGHGIVVRGLRHRIAACTIEDTGASGITLDGGDRQTLTPGGHVVEDCEITRFGRLERTYRPAVAISGVGHRVAHNRIHDAPHTAILIAGNDHIIELNEISHVLLETGDCGAIYAGRDWAMHGTVIRHNLIHDLPGTEDRWQNAIYLDDMASGISVEGNVLWRCNLGMLIGGGRAVSVRHNVLIDCQKGLRFDARGVGWMAKHIADPATSTLHQRLAKLPVDEPPWSERYPEVQLTLTEGFGRPVGSTVSGNAFFRTPFGSVDDDESVTVDGNRSFDRELDPTGREWLDVRDLPGFPAIPIGTVGPRPGR